MRAATAGGVVLAVLAALAVLAGCAAPPPSADARRGGREPAGAAAARPPEAWQAPWPSSSGLDGASAADERTTVAWWARFDDPLLPALIDAAVAASPTLSAAAARIEQARAARVAAGSALRPALDASATALRNRSAPEGPIVESQGIGLQAAWEVDLFGRRGAASDAAAARLVAAQAQWHAARVALAAEAGGAYVALRACEAQLGQADADVASREQTARLTDDSVRAGLQAPAHAALARASAAQARAQREQQRAACAQQLKALVALTGWSEPELRARLAPGSARLPAAGAGMPARLPAALLQQRPDLLAAARALEAAAADRDEAVAARLPQVTFSGSLGGLRVSTAAGTASGSVWSLGPIAVTLPLFDGGRRAAGERAARAAYDDALVQLQAALRHAVREVEETLVALHGIAAREADTHEAVRGFEAALRAADARWRGGVASLYELEDARRSALAARSAWIELQRERATAWIQLYRALGGGFDPDALDAGGDARAAAPTAATPSTLSPAAATR